VEGVARGRRRDRLIVNLRRAGILVFAALLLAGGGLLYWRGRPLSTAAQMKRLPASGSVIVYVDFDQLRRGGILDLFTSGKAVEDDDYRKFAQSIHLDWRKDLDSAMVAFAPSGKYMLVRGRFDWTSLRTYARQSGGDCEDDVCRMAGSVPDRRISFFPMSRGLMALAVSTDDMAAKRMIGETPGPEPQLPSAPLWMRIPGSVLKTAEDLPSGTRMFARTVGAADFVTLTFVPEGNRLAARLDVLCQSEQDAAAMAAELGKTTTLLREFIEREHQKPNPADFSGVLTSGTFSAQGRRVVGHWPIERSFVENVLGGGA
jgi:hypothetical protein